jgi:hypothetical protein
MDAALASHTALFDRAVIDIVPGKFSHRLPPEPAVTYTRVV